MTAPVTITQHIMIEQRRFPQARGDFSMLFNELVTAAKIISREVNKAGLLEDILGATGAVNVQGEQVQKLDEYADKLIAKTMGMSGLLAGMASEENEDVIMLPDDIPTGDYILTYDPLDGSSNIDVNVNIGTIFSIYRMTSSGDKAQAADFLQPGKNQIAAGYVIYGSSTMLVYTAGRGVYGFTLDPSVGEFLLSHTNIQTPKRGKIYSINEGNREYWDEKTRAAVEWFHQKDKSTNRPYSLRYIGSLVADFHRNLLKGGVFLYPMDYKNPDKPEGKLRYLYEAAPLAFIVEQAGGAASTGTQRILDIVPDSLHMRVPLIIGSEEDVATMTAFYK